MTDPSAILALAETYARAVWEKDQELFLSIYDDKLLAYDTWDSWSIEGRRRWGDMASEWFGSLQKERVRAVIVPERIDISGDMALLAGALTFTAISPDDRELRSITSRLTWSLRQGPSGWTITHEHGSAPVDFADHKADFTGPGS
ncbi:YybH family protein [Pseudoroseicyclus tamaricis]|uniref:Nuclear transport factor 2 family protein n=1 Tax=Pseudoroseicyclus tamaricis TaxID=2705421 RepID=A0A6B2JPQ8_9RHOB|nr:nuclear transport factor 2 family protein [Pseudoroseicyclus tamaricis]NDV00667.1 nuclear transport factor 2 family protein [Pseudoroseicyclus tamaricis]